MKAATARTSTHACTHESTHAHAHTLILFVINFIQTQHAHTHVDPLFVKLYTNTHMHTLTENNGAHTE